MSESYEVQSYKGPKVSNWNTFPTPNNVLTQKTSEAFKSLSTGAGVDSSGRINSALDELYNQIASVSELVTSLEKRLDYVLTPSAPSTGVPADCAPREFGGTIYNRVCDDIETLRQIRMRFSDILSRIEA